MQIDPQIGFRFAPFALPRWRESAGARAFVVSFGRLLPLHMPSPFGDKHMIQEFIAYSDGLTGKTTTVLVKAADQAALAGIFRIQVEEEADDALV